jgi:hypothetical protein
MTIVTVEPPGKLDGAHVERFASVLGLSLRVSLFMDGNEVEQPSMIAICRYSGDESAFLFHCSPEWVVLAAGHYESIEAAEQSANRAYPGVSMRWVVRS